MGARYEVAVYVEHTFRTRRGPAARKWDGRGRRPVTRSVLVREDLFTATIPPLRTPAHPPWPAASTLYPAMFGGAIAGAAIALMNGARLGLHGRHRATVAGVALAALVGRMLLLRSGLDLTGLYAVTVALEGVV